ncbi:MAG: hypothetical protein GKR86_15835, partial [Ilumatobacter sp.]|nr:hypothetical protein [Ilumatobacter sp.]
MTKRTIQHVDGVLVVHAPATIREVGDHIAAVESASLDAHKPVVAVMLGASDGQVGAGNSVPNFLFPEQAAAVLGRVAAYSAWRRAEAESSSEVGEHSSAHIDAARAGSLVRAGIESGSMPPAAMADLLDSYGIRMAETLLVDADDACAAADSVGYPVAVKAIGRRVGRSVEAGIALDVRSRDDVATAVEAMTEHL